MLINTSDPQFANLEKEHLAMVHGVQGTRVLGCCAA